MTILARLGVITYQFFSELPSGTKRSKRRCNVELMANNQREVMIKALSEVDFTQPILTLLQAIKIQREQYANNKQVSVNTGPWRPLLSRLYKARAKEIKTVPGQPANASGSNWRRVIKSSSTSRPKSCCYGRFCCSAAKSN